MPESYQNDDNIAEVSVLYNNDQLSNKAKLMEVPLDFSVIKVKSKLGCNVSSMPIFICDVEIGFK